MRGRALPAAALALVMAAHPAAAADGGDLVVLTVAADEAEVARLGEHLRPLLASAGFTLALRRVDTIARGAGELARRSPIAGGFGNPPSVPETVDTGEATGPTPAGAVAWARGWIDLTRPANAVVFFARPGASRAVMRGVPLRGKVDAVARAEIGEILLAALAAPAEAPPADVAVPAALPPAPRAPRVWRTTLGLVGAAEGWAQAAPLVPALGLSARFAFEGPGSLWSAGAWVMLRYRASIETAAAPVGVRLQGGEADVLFVVSRPLGTRTVLGLAGGLGADARFARPVAPPDRALVPAERPRDLALVARTALLLERALGERLGLVAALTLDALPLQGRYVVTDQQGARLTIFTPWPVRPGAVLGLTWRP